ncbi:hypothetical protein U1872_08115 [Sphingomonas sp. RB3P16]|uniref:hypothetical protein n=1 Tax=Parasphingomonas frigoris TaxID=3096163 RepID=UPI002FC97B46
MATDLFASIRKHDTGESTSFRAPEHLEHPIFDEVFPEKRLISAAGTPRTRGTPEIFNKPETVARSVLLTVPQIRDSDYRWVPIAWRDGLARLNRVNCPSVAEPARWAQIVLDAHKFAWGWNDDTAIESWSIGSLFGFDQAEPDVHSLILDIRGGNVIAFNVDDRGRQIATIAQPGKARWHYRRMRDDAPPIWTVGGES